MMVSAIAKERPAAEDFVMGQPVWAGASPTAIALGALWRDNDLRKMSGPNIDAQNT